MRVLSGMRPTGKLHLGHWVGVLSNWISMQDSYECFFMVADWHALMSEYKDTRDIKEIIVDNVSDWLAWGIDPERSTIFIQSEVSAHLELFMILSVLTPLGWLFRCPTFKEQIKQLKDKEINTYAFLGYPVLQTADILLYNADSVPVGEDQLAHLELAREIVRRFHFIYKKDVFVEPQPLLTKVPRLLGLDGRKMSKTYNNFIALDEDEAVITKKILSMFTDPQRLRKQDKGNPLVCNVFSYYKIFKPEQEKEVYDYCTQGLKGCKECKKILAKSIIEFVSQRRARKKKFLKEKDLVYDILKQGKDKAERVVAQTMREVKDAIGL
jgi:tryptophanyl-tRNA synthetase